MKLIRRMKIKLMFRLFSTLILSKSWMRLKRLRLWTLKAQLYVYLGPITGSLKIKFWIDQSAEKRCTRSVMEVEYLHLEIKRQKNILSHSIIELCIRWTKTNWLVNKCSKCHLDAIQRMSLSLIKLIKTKKIIHAKFKQRLTWKIVEEKVSIFQITISISSLWEFSHRVLETKQNHK